MSSTSESQVGQTTAADSKKTLTLAIWLQLLILGGGYMFYTMNRFTFPIGLKDIGVTYGFAAVQTSALGTVFLLGQGIMDIPAGYMADHLNRRLLFFGSMFSIGLFVICFTLFTYGFISAVVWRVVFGMAEGTFNICLIALAGALLPNRRGFLNNMLGFFFGVGGFIGPLLFGLIQVRTHTWQSPIRVIAAATMIYAVFMLLTLRVQDKDIPALAFHRMKIPEGETFFTAFSTLVRLPAMWKAMSIYFFIIISEWSYAGVGPYILIKLKHVDTVLVGSMVATAFGISALVAPFFGYLADRLGRRPVIFSLAPVACVAMYVTFISPVMYKPYLLTCAFLTGLSISTIYYLGYTVVQDVVPARFHGFATGMTGGCGYFLASLSGWAIGILAQHFGYLTAVWIMIIGCQFMVVPCALFWLPSRKKLVART